ncbi:hypothetical protein QRD43_21060 [Pelomonas sp. APW6]|uniref:Uncharacterized protein n=1 Tax=Roseateles subflavus TaxID=3053353 RepID=A0ABT7LSH2_9BURK|nr:hypothetical protein [Pelomonas sp. APW6]MDL5034406.1 hypothetical protein [Pelomonas sp. APW6]
MSIHDKLSQFERAIVSKEHLFLSHLGQAIPGDIYHAFAMLRDEIIPTLRRELSEALAAHETQQPPTPQAVETVQAAFVAWLSGTYPDAWPLERAEQAWRFDHVAALAWQEQERRKRAAILAAHEAEKQAGPVAVQAYAPAPDVAALQRDLARAHDSATGFVAEIKLLKQHIRELRAFQAMVNRYAPEFPVDPDAPRDVWYWQGDGHDHLESMVHQLPVVIRAEQLRELLAAAQAPAATPAAPPSERAPVEQAGPVAAPDGWRIEFGVAEVALHQRGTAQPTYYPEGTVEYALLRDIAAGAQVEAPDLLRMVLDDIAVCIDMHGEHSTEVWESKELSTETVETLEALRRKLKAGASPAPAVKAESEDALAERLRNAYHSQTRIGHPLWQNLDADRKEPWLAVARAVILKPPVQGSES